MLFSLLANEQLTVSLHKNVPAPADSSTDTTPPVTFNWSAEGSTGVRQYAYRHEAVYTPLLRMRSIRKPLLRRDEKGLGKDGWVTLAPFNYFAQDYKYRWYETDVPWPDLDEDGATEPEDVYEDGPLDDDDDD